MWHLLPKKPGRQRHTGSPSVTIHAAPFWQSDWSQGLVCRRIMGGGFSQKSPLGNRKKKRTELVNIP